MILGASVVVGLALRCAPNVAPQTLLAITQTESGLNPFAIGVNRGGSRTRQPQSRAEAIDQATKLIAQGANVDLGLAQINSANLAPLGLSVEAAFDPCRNLMAAAAVLQSGYRAARIAQPDPQRALRTAFSLYNTGHPQRGFANGYVARIERSAASAAPTSLEVPLPDFQKAAPWDAFGDLRPAAFVTASTFQNGDQP